MLKNEVDLSKNLLTYKEAMASHLSADLAEYVTKNDEVMTFDYPVIDYPDKVKSATFDKEAIFEGELKGIKGQYLILTDNRVLNIRRHSGYYIIFRD